MLACGPRTPFNCAEDVSWKPRNFPVLMKSALPFLCTWLTVQLYTRVCCAALSPPAHGHPVMLIEVTISLGLGSVI